MRHGIIAIGTLFFSLLSCVGLRGQILNSMANLDNSETIKPGYTLSYSVLEDRSAPQALTVNASGAVAVPLLPQMQAAGLTSRQFAYNCKKALEHSQYREATVIVTIQSRPTAPPVVRDPNVYQPMMMDSSARFVTVYGMVGRQGKLLLPEDGKLTISEAILQSGGFAQFAKKNQVEILRRIGARADDLMLIYVDVDAIMRNGRLDYDIWLRADDVIIVKEKLINT